MTITTIANGAVSRGHVEGNALVCRNEEGIRNLWDAIISRYGHPLEVPAVAMDELERQYDCWQSPPDGYEVEIKNTIDYTNPATGQVERSIFARVSPLDMQGVDYYVQAGALLKVKDPRSPAHKSKHR
jgi:hypothetical protein